MSIPRTKLAIPLLMAAAMVALAPGEAAAQAAKGRLLDKFTLSLMGGLGGSVDENEAGYDNGILQLAGSFSTDQNVEVGLRIGRLSTGSDERLGDLFDAQVTYVSLAAEYGFAEAYYESGLFFGIGYYDIEGSRPFGGVESETRLGLTGGATGDFEVTDRLSIVAELTGHAVPGAEAQFFATGMVGVALRFR